MAGGPAAHKEAVRLAHQELGILARQQKAWDLFLAGATFEQIGAQLKVSNKTAWCDCVAWRDAIRERALMDGQLRLVRQLARLDQLYLAHYPCRGEKASADVLLKVMDHEAKLTGLYASTMLTATDTTDTRPFAGLSDENLEAELRTLALDLGYELRPLPVGQRPPDGHPGGGTVPEVGVSGDHAPTSVLAVT